VPTGRQRGKRSAHGDRQAHLIVRYCAGAIGPAGLGNALVAPVLAYVPEGGLRSAHGQYDAARTIG